MNSLRALIIDDEPLAHKVILKYAADVPFLEIVGQCYKATEAYPLLEDGTVDLIFLDINMPRLKGLDFLRTLPQPPLVIVTSAYEEYALEGYELRITDYLLKPFAYDRFLKAVNTARQSHAPGPSPSAPPPLEAKDQIFVKVDKRHQLIRFADIQYLESYGNYVKIWTSTDCLLTANTLSKFLEDLPDTFLRIHKSYVIRTPEIDYVEGGMIVLRSGKTLPVGKSYRKVVREWLGG
ncbi:MAG: LytTR family DNA-binding domain-containing protein [Bacteroidota bacterium]